MTPSFTFFISLTYKDASGATIGDDSIRIAVADIELFRDEACTLALTDWPATAALIRSPKHLLRADDYLWVRVTGLDTGPTLEVSIASDSDTNGINLLLDKQTDGTYRNTIASGNRLAVSDATSHGAIDKIKVVDEEVLSLSLTEHPTVSHCVMVDRREFAACGIAELYVDLDRPVVRNGAFTQNGFWNAGDSLYHDAVGGRSAMLWSGLSRKPGWAWKKGSHL